MDTFRVSLIGQRFYSRIGVFEQERKVGNEFLVDLWVEYEAGRFRYEDLSSGVSYADLYAEVKACMDEERLLLESICISLRDVILQKWPFIREGYVRIVKVSPPVSGMEGSCGVELNFKKAK